MLYLPFRSPNTCVLFRFPEPGVRAKDLQLLLHVRLYPRGHRQDRRAGFFPLLQGQVTESLSLSGKKMAGESTFPRSGLQ